MFEVMSLMESLKKKWVNIPNITASPRPHRPPHCFVLQQINVFKLQTETEIRRFTVKYPVKHWRSYFVDIQDLATTQLTTLASSFPLIKSSHQDPDELSH